MTTLVYAYDARPPVAGGDLIDTQISLAHRYFNRLIEIRRAALAAAEDARRRHCPDLAAAEAAVTEAAAAVESLRAAIRRRNAAGGKKGRLSATPEDRAQVKAARQALGAARARRKAERERLRGDPVLVQRLAGIFAESQADVRRARAECGVWWGTYLAVEQAVESACQKTKGPPHFKRWTGDGLVAVQVQKGMTAGQLLGRADTRLRLEMETGPARHAGKARITIYGRSGSKRCRPRGTLWLRVGSEGRDPVWARVPVSLHRELPADAVIMGCQVVRRQVAVRRKADGAFHPYYEWSVHFTVRTERQRPMTGTGCCGVDVGWRLLPDGSLRVAYVVGEDGRDQDVRLPPKLLARWKLCEDLQSIRDNRFLRIKGDLANWLGREGTVTPDWFRDQTATLPQWRGKGRLASLVRRWTGERFAGDEMAFRLARQWLGHDAHLWQYQRHNRQKAERTRKHLYRRLAAELAGAYGQVSVEDCDWRELARLPTTESNTAVNETARYWQRVAAVGMLRQCLTQRGAGPEKGENTTRECCRCGQVNTFEDQAPLVLPYCCGPLDQDCNAALVLLARGRALKSGDGPDGDVNLSGDNGLSPRDGPDASRGPESNGETSVAAERPLPRGRWARRKASRSREQAERTVIPDDAA